MPYKKGPHNTLRLYSKTTGKYIKNTNTDMFSTNKKLTKKDKSALRNLKKQQYLFEKALKSPDPLLYDVFNFLSKEFPNSIEDINERIYIKEFDKSYEMDIIGRNYIVEIKSGRKPGALNQCLIHKKIEKLYKRKAILYAPNITNKALKIYSNYEITVVKNFHQLREAIKSWTLFH